VELVPVEVPPAAPQLPPPQLPEPVVAPVEVELPAPLHEA
jgi:hypothetical protein